jgi:hypothetical protein
MRNAQIIPQRDEAEEELVVWLKAKSTQELDQFLAGSWTASILSSETLEELHKYQERRQKEESPKQLYR